MESSRWKGRQNANPLQWFHCGVSGDREDPPVPVMVPFDLRGTPGALIVHTVLKGYCPGSSQSKGSPAWFPLPAPRRGDRRGVSTQEKLLVGEGLARRLSEYFYFLNLSTLEARNTTKLL